MAKYRPLMNEKMCCILSKLAELDLLLYGQLLANDGQKTCAV